jgi:MraZ protein
MRFIGTVDAKVDQKGRVFLPALFRRMLQNAEGERLILRKDIFEDCLVVYPEGVWNARLDELRQRLSVWNREQQQMFRQFVKDVEWLSLDGSGRFLIPKRYLHMAHIGQDVTFVGMDDTIELWARPAAGEAPDDAEDANLGDALQTIMEQ